ncbi:MAG: LEA type 2 family protein [Bacteroidota bacterium]
MNQLWTKWLMIVGVTVMIASCAAPEAPDFKGIKNMKVNVEGLSRARLNGDAVFFNPNDRKITLKKVDVEVSVEGQKVKDISREFDITAEPNSEVTVPIDVTLTLEDLNMNLLSTAMSMLNGEEKKIRYKGKARVKMYGVSFSVPFDYEDDVNIAL